MSIIFQSSFKLARSTNGIYKGGTIWLLHFSVEKQARAALNSRIDLSSRSSIMHQKEGGLKVNCKVIQYLLEMYTTDDVVAETYA